IARLEATIPDDRLLVEELFLAILSRRPTPAEVEYGLKALNGSEAEFARLEAENAKARAALEEYERQLPERMAKWLQTTREGTSRTVREPTALKANGGTELTNQPDLSVLATGKNPTPAKYTVTAPTKLTGITAFRLEVLPDPSLPAQGPGRAS